MIGPLKISGAFLRQPIPVQPEVLVSMYPVTTVRGPFQMHALDAAALEHVYSLWPRFRAWMDQGEPWGCYLLVYEVGALKEPHKDPPKKPGGRHDRLIMLLQGAEGGDLYLAGDHYALEAGEAICFRPDLVEHWVTEVTAGKRIVLTLGKCHDPAE